MKLKPAACAVVMAFAAPALYAETVRPETAELETITVTADRNAQKLDRAAPNVAVVSRQALNQAAAANLDDVFLYEPGVWVPSDNTRRGNAGVNIRGIDGNRILMMVDGVRLPEAYAGGGNNNGAVSGRDLVEPDTLKQVDIVKGPYSALYGSDALGGVVNLATYSPRDFVDAEKPYYFGLKYGYHSRGNSHGVTATAAGHTENAEGLLMLTRRQGHETKNKGSVDTRDSSRTKNNPQDNSGYNILAKGNIGNENHRLEAVFEQFYRKNETDLLNTLGSSSVVRGTTTVTTTQSLAEAYDSARRQRFGLGYRYNGEGRLKEAEVMLYRQQLKAQDDAVNVSETAINGRPVGSGVRYSDYGFDQTANGISSRAVAEFDTGRLKHTVVAGTEFKHVDTERSRDSTTVNSDGSTSKSYAGSLYPNKTFPDSKRRTFSVYAQDSIAFANGVVLTPALRYEYEKLKPQIDQAYLNANPESLPQNFSDSAITPSLRLSWPMGDAFTGFATYSQGFRTPPFDSATMSFSNTLHGYQIVPNNNLKSERSNSFELGLKYKGANSKAQVTAFYNRYRDFISRQFVGMANGLQIFRFDNLDKVKTYGVEAAASHRLNDAWHLNGSIAWMRGEDGEGKALDTAYPLNGVLGLDYVQEKWGAGAKLRWAAKQKRVSDESFFKTPGYGVWDIGAWYKPVKNVELGLNLYNLGNKKYWQHVDVAGMADTGVMDLYSMSGRNVAATVQIKF
ncbi:TonB-dependent hemoglobin/transferrin/lactoferrin family receptor [Neisseria dentiae]|uniref:TonB-dependent hemoglobin/transferrin/lactoferrin family receptor n=1 Tax=Neisseria dentiae TaxID=194197 RepID=UPI0035A02B0E